MGKIRFEPVAKLPDATLRAQREYSRGLGLPEIIRGVKPTIDRGLLLILGGSPEITGRTDDIRQWNGDIWAINGAWQWCHGNGIDATFYRIDPEVGACENAMLGNVRKAVLADMVEPGTFDALIAAKADIRLFRLGSEDGAFPPETTAAATAPQVALWHGYRGVHFLGCESSFCDGTHAYKKEAPNLVWVECGGREYVTSPQMIMQAESIADAARAFPAHITIAGGGFLKALAEHGTYRVTHISPAIDRALKESAA